MDQVQEISTVQWNQSSDTIHHRELEADEPKPFFGPSAGKNRHVHHPGPDRPRGRIQYCRIPGHDGHGKTKGYRHSQNHGGNGQSIGRIFVIKGLMIGSGGNGAGNIGGGGGVHPAKRYSFIHLPADVYYISTLPVNLKPSDVLLIACSALCICFAATLYPARQAAGIDPVEAIRHG
jgi:hypothetical protein